MKLQKMQMLNEEIENQKQLQKIEKKNKQDTMPVGIVCYILIPMILSFLVTTGISLTIITILSPYWSRVGGIQLVDVELKSLKCLSIVQGQSVYSILQRISIARSQILVTYWNNLHNYQQLSPQIDAIYNSQSYSLYRLLNDPNGQYLSTVRYYDAVSQTSSSAIGWALVNEDGEMLGSQELSSEQL